jgi:Secretion system C-terminal sorting domain
MKQKLFLLIILLITSQTHGQNLVPNPSFEDTVYCPFGSNQLNASEHWLNFGNSPDYFNACTYLGLPNSNPGFQYAHTGNAYAGAIFFARSNIPNGPNYREPIGIELSNNLIIGQKYFVSFFAVNAEVNFGSIASDKLGVNFYTVPFDSCCPPPLINTAKLYTDSILTDTLNWIKISGSFIADSAYQYLCISNFFNDNNTDTLSTSQFPTRAYYYIDDVCVSTDSLYNETWTGINQTANTQNTISVLPNPSNGTFNINSNVLGQFNLTIMDGAGKIVFNDLNCSNQKEIDINYLQNGIYFLVLEYSDGNHKTSKLVINH